MPVSTFDELISLESAQGMVLEHVAAVVRTESVGIGDALGRVLSEDVIACYDVPGYNRAAKDGFAVRTEDTQDASAVAPVILRLVDTVCSGEIAMGRLGAGTCIEVATGSMIPEGADAVVMVEETDVSGDRISIRRAVAPLDNMGLRGENICRGDTVMKKGEWLTYRKIGVLASQGMEQVNVLSRPTVAVVPTGDEVIVSGMKLGLGQMYDVNSYNLAAVVKENGGTAVTLAVARDDARCLKDRLNEALKADLVVTSGGVSVGRKDLLASALQEIGRVYFHGVRIKPGRPTMFAVVGGKPVLGMPGYPAACFINAYLLLGPAVRKMAGLPPRNDVSIEAKLGERVFGAGNSRRFQLVRFEGDTAHLLPTKPSSVLNIARADGYVVVPEGRDYLDQGSIAKVVLF